MMQTATSTLGIILGPIGWALAGVSLAATGTLYMKKRRDLSSDEKLVQIIKQKYPETFQYLDEEIELLRSVLGALYSWLVALAKKLRDRVFHKKPMADVVQSEEYREQIFDEAMEVAASVNVNSQDVSRALLTTPPNRIVHLLSSGLEKGAAEESQQQGLIDRLKKLRTEARGKLQVGRSEEDLPEFLVDEDF